MASTEDKVKLLVVLQCAYGNTKKRRRQLKKRRLWLKGLWDSHTGKRLKEMLPDNMDYQVINSTPKIGDRSDAVFPPDPVYIQAWVECYEPDYILACGKVAQEALEELGLEFFRAPHPAWRLLSKEDTSRFHDDLAKLAGEKTVEKKENDWYGIALKKKKDDEWEVLIRVKTLSLINMLVPIITSETTYYVDTVYPEE